MVLLLPKQLSRAFLRSSPPPSPIPSLVQGMARRHATNGSVEKKSAADFDSEFQRFVQTFGLQGIATLCGAVVGCLTVSVYMGTYTLRHDIDSRFNQVDARFNQMDARFIELKAAVDDKSEMNEIKAALAEDRKWHFENIEKQNARLDKMMEKLFEQDKKISQQTLATSIASSTPKNDEDPSKF